MFGIYYSLGGFFLSFLISILLIPVVIRLSHRYKWYDMPDKRKIHTGLIPRLGGIGIFIGTSIAIIILLSISVIFRSSGFALFVSYRIFYLLTGLLLIYCVGLIDDFHNLKALIKFMFQLVAAGIITAGGYVIKTLTIPYLGTFSLGFISYPVTVLWIVGIANSINLVDGMDGLAGGITGFAALSIGIIMLIHNSPVPALISFALLGSIIGFLIFNFPPAKIFMGDSGSLFLGFTLASLPLTVLNSPGKPEGILIATMTLLMIPILDTAAAIVRRVKSKKPIYAPDRKHIHHRLLDLGLSEKKILAVVYGFTSYLSLIAITSMVLPKEMNIYFILVIWIGSLLGYMFLNYIEFKKDADSDVRDNIHKNLL